MKMRMKVTTSLYLKNKSMLHSTKSLGLLLDHFWRHQGGAAWEPRESPGKRDP